MGRATGAASAAALWATGGEAADGRGCGDEGILMLGAEVGLGGKVIRTVSFFG